MKPIALAAAALLAAPSFAADAPKAKAAKAAPTLSRVAGKVLKSSVRTVPGKKGRQVFAEGRMTIMDDADHVEEYLVDAKTTVTCDGKKAAFAQAAVPGACDRAARVLYDAQKRVRVLELKTAPKAGADDAKGRPDVSGEIAVTDVLAGRISVRLGGGTTVDFKVGDATKISLEAEGKPSAPASFESLKVGDRVEVRSKDWKTADEIHVRAAPR